MEMNDRFYLSAPLSVDVMVTWKCQLDCIYCQPWLSRPSVKSLTELGTEDMLRVLDEVSSYGPVYIFLTGGEPLLRKDLPIFISFLKNKGVKWTTSSNGLFSINTLERAVNAGLQHLQIHIQGLENRYPFMTQTKGIQSNKPLQGVRLAAERGVKVSVVSVPTIYNFNDLPDMADQAAKAGASTFRILRLMTFRPYMLGWTVPLEKINQVIQEVARVCKQTGMALDVSNTPTDKVQMPIDELSHPYESICSAGKTKLCIMPDGEAIPCYSFYDPKFKLGNILSLGLEQVWNHPLMKELRNLDGNCIGGRCSRCHNKLICYSCRSIAYNCYGNMYESDTSCFVNQEDWQMLCNSQKCTDCSYNCDNEFRQKYVFNNKDGGL